MADNVRGFAETHATEKKIASKKRGRAPPGGFSPQKSPQPYKPKKITHAVPVVLVLALAVGRATRGNTRPPKLPPRVGFCISPGGI